MGIWEFIWKRLREGLFGFSEVSESPHGAGVSGRDEKIALLRIEVDALRTQVEYEKRLLSEIDPRRPNRQ